MATTISRPKTEMPTPLYGLATCLTLSYIVFDGPLLTCHVQRLELLVCDKASVISRLLTSLCQLNICTLHKLELHCFIKTSSQLCFLHVCQITVCIWCAKRCEIICVFQCLNSIWCQHITDTICNCSLRFHRAHRKSARLEQRASFITSGALHQCQTRPPHVVR